MTHKNGKVISFEGAIYIICYIAMKDILYLLKKLPPPSPEKNLQIPEQEQALPPPAANPSLDIVQELDIFTIEEELVLETISAEPEVDEKKKNLQSSMENMTPRKRKGLEEKPNIRIGRVCGRRRH